MAVAPKAKRRNSERRKEHSRDAARSRRSREAEVFLHLAQEIPLPYDSVKVLDKTSIIRLATTYLKLRTLLASEDRTGNDPRTATNGHVDQRLNQLYHRAVDGFLMVVASDGDVLFVTDNIASFLGLTQIDVMGQSIYDLSHPCDHDEVREMIGAKSRQPTDDGSHRRDIFVRMKSTITSKGRNVNIKSASYKVISCSGHPKTVRASLREGEEEETASFVVIVGRSIGHPSNVEVPLDSRTFVSRHSLDMKFTECDERIHELLGYRADELLGRSMYSFQHALDAETLDRTFRTLFCKGQATTGLYRFLARRGGFIWLETEATVVNNIATDKPEYVVCLNHVVSGVECPYVVFDMVQLCPSNDVDKAERSGDKEATEASLVLTVCPDAYKDDEQDAEQLSMQFVTERILEQAAKEKDDPNSEMIHRMTCFLLDPSSEMSSDPPVYPSNRPALKSDDFKTSDMVGNETDEGLTKNLSNSSLFSLLDKLEAGMEMRAPYIPMDDLVFSSSVETPLVQSYGEGTQLSCLMNSDPLLPSVGPDLPDPLTLFFTTNPSESESPSPQKPHGTKRSYSPPDDINLTTAPCKVPRLDNTGSTSGLDRSVARRAPVSTVTTLTGPVIHAPPFATTHGADPENQVAFFSVENPIGATEIKHPTPIVYLLVNGQLTPMTAVTTDGARVQGDRQGVEASVGTAQGVRVQPRATQWAVGNSSHPILDLSSLGNGPVRLVPGENVPGPHAERSTVSKASYISNNKYTALMYAPTKIGNGQQMTADHTNTNVNKDSFLTYGTLPSPQPAVHIPPARKDQIPFQQATSQSGFATQERYHHAAGETRGVSGSVGGEKQLPLRLKLPGGCMPLKQMTPDFLKVLESENGVTGTKKSDGSIGKLSILNSSTAPQPLQIIQERVASVRGVPGAGAGPPRVEGMRGLFVQPGIGAVASTRGQLQKPKAQVIIRSIRQQPGFALKGVGLQMAAPCTDNSDGVIRQQTGNDANAGQAQRLTVPCSGVVMDSTGSSVLKNLLMKGVDVNYGYRLQSRTMLDCQKQLNMG